jgi:sugar transferase (PEP-CTERM system associated)
MQNKSEKLMIIGDILLVVLALYVGQILRFGVIDFYRHGLVASLLSVATVIFTVIFSSFIMELYNNEVNTSRTMIFIRVAGVVLISYMILSAVFYMLPPQLRMWRGEVLLSLLLVAAGQLLWHVIWLNFIGATTFAKKVLVIGTGPLANKIGRLIVNTNHRHTLAGYYQCSLEDTYVPSNSIIGNGDDIATAVARAKASKIVVSLSDRRRALPIDGILACKLKGVEVIDAPSFYEQLTGKLFIEAITPAWFVFSDGFKLTPLKILVKNTLDKIFALCLFTVTMPLFPIIAVLIKLESKGPIFYRQIRVGQGERLISIYKFRSMRQDAENTSGAVWAKKNDMRITRIGSILRKTRLDEIPQLINVLKGEMSFIGPRPERPEFVEKLKEIIPYYSERHSVKPGITGWAQVKYPYGASVEDAIEKLRYDLYYIKNLSLLLDTFILLETVRVVLFRKGSR